MPLLVLNRPESDDLSVVDDASTGAPLVAGLGSIAAIVESRETCGGGKAGYSHKVKKQYQIIMTTCRL